MPEDPLPIFDPGKLAELAHQTTADAAARFGETYQRMLPQRVRRIVRALNRHDVTDAMDAALSLRISSAMTGALMMEGHCVQLISALRTANRQAAMEASRGIQGHHPLLEAFLRHRLTPVDAAA
jgi:hypothetical protein